MQSMLQVRKTIGFLLLFSLAIFRVRKTGERKSSPATFLLSCDGPLGVNPKRGSKLQIFRAIHSEPNFSLQPCNHLDLTLPDLTSVSSPPAPAVSPWDRPAVANSEKRPSATPPKALPLVSLAAHRPLSSPRDSYRKRRASGPPSHQPPDPSVSNPPYRRDSLSRESRAFRPFTAPGVTRRESAKAAFGS